MFKNSSKIIKFAMVGILNTGLDFIVFYLLYDIAGFYYLYAHIIAFTVAATNSFLLNALWTFRRLDRARIYFQLISFFVITICAMAISSFIVFVAVGYINVYLAKILATMVAMGFNFLGVNFITFNKKFGIENET